jgi:hypothetical protein
MSAAPPIALNVQRRIVFTVGLPLRIHAVPATSRLGSQELPLTITSSVNECHYAAIPGLARANYAQQIAGIKRHASRWRMK